MDDVRVLYRLRQNFFVRLCQAHAVPFERGVKRTEIERGNRIIIFFACRIGVGGYDFYAMSLIRQVMDKIKAIVVPLFGSPSTSQIMVTFIAVLRFFRGLQFPVFPLKREDVTICHDKKRKNNILSSISIIPAASLKGNGEFG